MSTMTTKLGDFISELDAMEIERWDPTQGTGKMTIGVRAMLLVLYTSPEPVSGMDLIKAANQACVDAGDESLAMGTHKANFKRLYGKGWISEMARLTRGRNIGWIGWTYQLTPKGEHWWESNRDGNWGLMNTYRTGVQLDGTTGELSPTPALEWLTSVGGKWRRVPEDFAREVRRVASDQYEVATFVRIREEGE
jgi:hypothetical protein